MKLPSDTPRLPKWIFLVGDAALLAMAWVVASQSVHPLTGSPLVAIIALALGGVALSVYPFIAEFTRRQEEALDDRQRALQALAGTVASSAEQIAIAASGLDRLAGIAQENFNQSDRVARQISEKMDDLLARLADAKRADAESAARIEAAAKKAARAAADLEAATSRSPEASRGSAPAQQPAFGIELPPVLTSQIVEIRPAASHSSPPFPPQAAPEAAAPEGAPAPEVAAPRRRPARRPAAEAAPDLILEAQPAAAAAPDPAAPAAPADGATRLVVTAYIGIGNRLFIRGSGPGLAWDKGVPLTFVSIGKWRWETSDTSAAVKFKLYKNDEIECTALGERAMQPGAQQSLTASF